ARRNHEAFGELPPHDHNRIVVWRLHLIDIDDFQGGRAFTAQHADGAPTVAPEALRVRTDRLDYRAAPGNHITDATAHAGLEVDVVVQTLDQNQAIDYLADTAAHRRVQPFATAAFLARQHGDFVYFVIHTHLQQRREVFCAAQAEEG